MPQLLQRPFGNHGKVHEITPTSAGWRYVGFSLYRLRAGETVAEATGDVLVPHIRVVHISGISGGSGDLTDAQDAERVLVGESDRTDTLGQMRRLLAAGYRGPFSFECTAPSVREREDLKAPIAASIAYLRHALATGSA